MAVTVASEASKISFSQRSSFAGRHHLRGDLLRQHRGCAAAPAQPRVLHPRVPRALRRAPPAAHPGTERARHDEDHGRAHTPGILYMQTE